MEAVRRKHTCPLSPDAMQGLEETFTHSAQPPLTAGHSRYRELV